MSNPYDGSDWNRPMQSTAGSVKRARERAQQGGPRRPPPPPMMADAPSGLSPPPSRAAPAPNSASQKIYKQRVAPAIQGRLDQQSISRPTRVPQWPLPGSPQTPTGAADDEPYQAPPSRAQPPPQRPPRPSVVPSLVDGSRLQEHTPVFFTRNDEEYDDVPDFVSPTSESRYTTSTIGSIPDFPEPAYAPNTGGVPPRRSANLGPPPSSRRGASSFYSHASYVSPIPEESPRSRSRVSGASSGVIPDNQRLGTPVSPGYPASPGYDDVYYDDSFTNRSRESGIEEFGDESKLVRSVSIGKKGKPALVVTRGPSASRTPEPEPMGAFAGGTAFKDDSTSSLTPTPPNKLSPESTSDEKGAPATAGAMLGAGAANGLRYMTTSPKPPSRLSAMRRPPKLDIDAVREMEARGSTTSLTDLIKRATRLASMIDRGKRPGSRLDNLNDYLDRSGGSGEKYGADEKHQSGLSDMLAAFPPPAQDARARGSWFQRTSWPLAPGRPGQQPDGGDGANEKGEKKGGRRCCGMRRWVFILLVIISLLLIAAAVVIPLQFFVFKTIGPEAQAQSSLDQCRSELKCENGGANVMVGGNCSCICTSGFVGKTCGIGGEQGCTTTNLVSSNGDTTVSDVTLGRAVPRIVAHSEDNFTIPLSGTAILARFSTANLSCIAQNSLVTFNGRATRVGSAGDEDISSISAAKSDVLSLAAQADEIYEEVPTLTEPASMVTDAPRLVRRQDEETKTTDEKLQLDTSASGEPSKTSTSKMAEATDDGAFRPTEDVLDFARVAVMYVLQEKSLSDAEDAQGVIQKFFTKAGDSNDDKATTAEAAKLKLADDITIDLTKFRIKLEDREVGLGTNETASNEKRDTPLTPMNFPLVPSRHRGSRLRRGHARTRPTAA